MPSDRPAVPPDTRHKQTLASDPKRSAWVSANAGSGKTFILARRVIRLLLEGVPPSHILCLTFTRAAAAEMANRVFETLASWTAMDDGELTAELRDIAGGEPDRKLIGRARTLFAMALDTPGGLKIQTIHAFCEALLHRFPLEAELPGHFRVMEGDVEAALIEQARIEVVSGLGETAGTKRRDRLALVAAFSRLTAGASDYAIGRALNELIAIRDRFGGWLDNGGTDPLAALRHMLGFRPDETGDEVIEQALRESTLETAQMTALAAEAADSAQANNREFAIRHGEYCASADPEEKFRIRSQMFLTKEGKPKNGAVTKKLLLDHPEYAALVEEEACRVTAAAERLKAISMLEMSAALFTLAGAVLNRYATLKQRTGQSDFNDLILAAANLLTRADVRGWVQYKLDKGVEHVLIDEAQDTSPLQWQIVNALVEEFFAGAGAGPGGRTVFAVGDEKQSIYSFQGADPQEFERQARTFELRSKNAETEFSRVRLYLSFRSAADILAAVDHVFKVPDNARGLGEDVGGTEHGSLLTHRGEVRIWPIFGKEKTAEQTSWLAPVDSVAGIDPAVELARRIARTVRYWIDSGTCLNGEGRPIRCGDILILVRRRDRFVNAVIREMKGAGLAIAGADRLILTEHIAAEDLVALGRFVVMREDDLSLAAVLKSPLFSFDEEMLMQVAVSRGGKSLIDRMHELAGDPETAGRQAIADAVARLERWHDMAQKMRPFEFYARILAEEGGRRAYTARLGSEVDDILDAFLQTALHHEQAGRLNIERFIAALTISPPQIKREVDMKRDEVRVITVHAAKGLEAPIVFLVDPCQRAFGGQHRPAIVEIGKGSGRHAFLWQAKAENATAVTRSAMNDIAQAAEEEYRRLLYVAMTRAAEKLVVCGWHGTIKPDFPHWHSMVQEALAPLAIQADDEIGEPALIFAREDSEPARRADRKRQEDRIPVPGWLQSAPAVATAHFVQPSSNGISQDSARMLGNPSGTGQASARAAGTAIHGLLQHLPDIGIENRGHAATAYLAASLPDWLREIRDEISVQICAVLEDPRLAFLFGPESRAEVGFTGQLDIAGETVDISGRVDRLVDLGDRIVIADFKSDRLAPHDARDIPADYLRQMALYRRAVREIFSGKKVECLLVWTRSGEFHWLESDRLDTVLATASVAAADSS
jgi:ATP-dependent helicase/nuclease subunit A